MEEEWDGEREPRPTSVYTAPKFRELVPSCIMLYVHRNHIIIWLIRDGGGMGWGMRTQAHLPVQFITDEGRMGWGVRAHKAHFPVHTAPTGALPEVEVIFFHGALRSHKPYIIWLIRDGARMEWRV